SLSRGQDASGNFVCPEARSNTLNSILDTYTLGKNAVGITLTAVTGGAGTSNTILMAHKALRPANYRRPIPTTSGTAPSNDSGLGGDLLAGPQPARQLVRPYALGRLGWERLQPRQGLHAGRQQHGREPLWRPSFGRLAGAVCRRSGPGLPIRLHRHLHHRRRQ